jgi:hypothetical protein
VIGALASGALTGWLAVAAREDFRDGRHSAAVAVAWSREREALFNAVRDRAIFPSAGWRGELGAFLDSGGLHGGGMEVFVDSSGYPHVLGVGRADWDGCAVTKNARTAAAVAMAKKNLLLALYGDEAVRERASRLMCEGRKGAERFGDVRSLYASFADVEVSMPLPSGVRDLRLMSVYDGATNGETIVSVFGFEPDPPSSSVSGKAPTPNPGTKVWNPIAGKFEGRE